MLLTLFLLGAAICSVWLPDVRTESGLRFSPWQVLFVSAVVSGLANGQLGWPAPLVLGAIWASAWASTRVHDPVHARMLTTAAALIALALSVHLLPGFNNPVVAADLKLSANAPAITQYAKFDKGAAGLILLAYFCRRVSRAAEWPSVIGVGIVVGAATSTVVIGLVAAMGLVEPDLKLPSFALAWVPINLLLTCVLEEGFFRGLIQERLTRQFGDLRRWRWAPVAVASLLFGLAHAGGGLPLIAAATVAGVGYGVAYATTRSIEAPIVAHFTLNAIHFFAFTYPYAVR